MPEPQTRLRTSIRLTVVVFFLLATSLTAAIAIGLQYYFGQKMAREHAQTLYRSASNNIATQLEDDGEANANTMALLAQNPLLIDASARDEHLRLFTTVMKRNPIYYGIYLGRSDGTFFEVVNLENSVSARELYRALPQDRWLVISVAREAEGSTRTFYYLDADLTVRTTRAEQTDFDVLSRPWYQSAQASPDISITEPYLFEQLGEPGQTLSQSLGGSNTVLGIDITLSATSAFLREHAISDHGEIYLYNAEGEVIASSVALETRVSPTADQLDLSEEEKQFVDALPKLRVSNELDWPPIDYAHSGQPQGYSVDLLTLLAQMLGVKIQFVNGFTWPELKEQYLSGDIDLLHSAIPNEQNNELGLLGESYLRLPFAIALPAKSTTNATSDAIKGKTVAIPKGWSILPLVKRQYPGASIVETESTLHSLELLSTGEVDAAIDNQIILQYISRHYFLGPFSYIPYLQPDGMQPPDSLHIIVPADRPQLRTLLDKAISAITASQRDYLSSKWLSFDSAQAAADSSAVPDEAMIRVARDHPVAGAIVETELQGQEWLLYVAPTYQYGDAGDPLYLGIRGSIDDIVSPFLEEVKLSITITAVFLLCLAPLSWLFANPIVNPIKQLAVQNDKVRRRDYDGVERISTRVMELDELSESMTVMVDAIKAHELAQRKLMDAFIELIAEAIDDKSAYTGGHCRRVPELAMMLAQHASKSPLPAFQGFKLETEDEWREYRIAAWLHDCGKITTPEHIVDKGTKLETIYNRIHEIRMRFEVLWRDAEIEYWLTLNEHPEDQHKLHAQMLKTQKQLEEEFNFVADCNVGGESLSDNARQRLRDIGQRTWTRHFDDQLGLSPVEELRLNDTGQTLPAEEPLLADKPEHILKRTRSTQYPRELGINMDIPEHLGNLGELYNLSVSRGTLTREDRFRINEHMISTIKMLESLPFPDELKNVPRYASTHHETLRGTGYPRKLSGDQLSIAERMLAVADVFEALTASDRPYKKAKPVSEALDIMHRMVTDNHLDADCFNLFIKERIYLEYADRFLEPSQVDDVDTGRYLRAS
ncbi:MAG: HD domain-containing phosphohydrolase [Pseudomonadota bacterium]